jgi:hypothetical protein
MTYSLIPVPAITDSHRAATKNRLGGSRIAGIVRAWHEIDPRCVTCDSLTWVDVMPHNMAPGDKATFGHIVPASVVTPGAQGGERGGYTADNGLLQCQDCQNGLSATTVTRGYFVPAYLGRFPRVTRRTAGQTDRGQAKAAARVLIGY